MLVSGQTVEVLRIAFELGQRCGLDVIQGCPKGVVRLVSVAEAEDDWIG